MKNFTSPLVAVCLSLPAIAGVEPPKTNSSLPIDDGLLSQAPYSLNGLVMTEEFRGSGFVAYHRNLFFTAAHVLYNDEGEGAWAPAPTWYGAHHDESEPGGDGIAARGYFRWASYADHVANSGTTSRASFSRDVALAWAFEPFTEETPAVIDFKGTNKLRSGVPSIITGYPAILDYTGESGNYLLHSTAEEAIPYKTAQANYLEATHISTGPGNSGGPVWVREGEGEWQAGGILVSGRPSEAGICGFTSGIKSLLKATSPVLADPVRSMKSQAGVGASSRLGVLAKPRTIPDGRHQWTRIPLNISGFPAEETVSFVRLNLTITTAHRGDLIVALAGPDGIFTIIQDGEGAGEDDVIFDDLDLSGDFTGSAATNGKWQLMVQDRLTGDIATVTRFQLEVGVD